MARASMWLGLAAWRLGDYAAARRDGEASLALKRRLGLDGELARSFNALGLLAWHEGRLRDALTHFDSAKVSARRNRDSVGVARAMANTPLVQVELGAFDAARTGFVTALQATRLASDELLEAHVLANLAMLEIRVGSPDAALPLLAEARRHYAELDYATGEANALGQLATAWSALGEIQRAIALADSAIAIAQEQGLLQEVAATLEVLADLHLQGGNPRAALRRLAEADTLDLRIGLEVERGNNLRRASAILLELGEDATAAARAEAAIEVHARVEAAGELVHDRLQLALALSAGGHPRRARREADRASHAARQLGYTAAIREAAIVLADLALHAEDPRSALEAVRGVGESRSTEDWRLQDLEAGALLALGQLPEARIAAERAVRLTERERASLGLGPLRAGFLSSRSGPYSRLTGIHLEAGDTAAAFAVAASVAGRGLAERLAGLSGKSAAIEDLREGEMILRRAAALEADLAALGRSTGEEERRRELERALLATRSAYEEHLSHRAVTPSSRFLGVGSVAVERVQEALDADDGLLVYLAGPDRLDLFVVRSGRLVHRAAAIGERELSSRIRIGRGVLGGWPAARPGVPPPLGGLSDLLIEPIRATGALDGATRLFIVPHGPLGAVPFAALWDRQSGRYLVEDREVLYLPAVSALEGGARVPGRGQNRLSVFAPLPESLPGTRLEAVQIDRRVAGAQVHLGRGSTEAAVRRALADGHSLHLASHGISNLQNPLFSRMVVGAAAREGSAPGDDGQLEVHEVLRLEATSPLVFLSGCETGLGRAGHEAFGAGVEEGSLAQAFLAAGAGTVVATLWRVGDAGAADLAERFYRHVGEGLAPGTALAEAQREAIRAGGSLTWAAYAAFGGVRRNPGPTRRVLEAGP